MDRPVARARNSNLGGNIAEKLVRTYPTYPGRIREGLKDG
jgi:hypothetical protein